jgi:hypothetical protein
VIRIAVGKYTLHKDLAYIKMLLTIYFGYIEERLVAYFRYFYASAPLAAALFLVSILGNLFAK